MDQLELDLGLEPCRSCGDARTVEPWFETWLLEPCPECCGTAWLIWLRNPYGLDDKTRCSVCRAFKVGSWCQRCAAEHRRRFFNEPARVGQLGLGFR